MTVQLFSTQFVLYRDYINDSNQKYGSVLVQLTLMLEQHQDCNIMCNNISTYKYINRDM